MSDPYMFDDLNDSTARLALPCEYCKRKRTLTREAQRKLDEAYNGRRCITLDPVQCDRCVNGWKLTPNGQALAILFTEYIDELRESAAQQAAADALPM